MLSLLKRWWMHPARWYQFWYPQSGIFGGFMGGVMLGIVAYVTQP